MKRTVVLSVGLVLLAPFAAARAAERPSAAGAADNWSDAPVANWPTNGGNYSNQRYSPLARIDRGNVAKLKGVWQTQLRGSGTGPQYSGEAQPIVYDGVAYVITGADDVFAVSIDSGKILWQYTANLDPELTSVCCGWTSRGVAVSRDKVFVGRLTRGSSRSIARPASRSGTSRPSAGRRTSRSLVRRSTTTAW
jgi:glucose dehydrogenase